MLFPNFTVVTHHTTPKFDYFPIKACHEVFYYHLLHHNFLVVIAIFI